jgi:hypothetical protein
VSVRFSEKTARKRRRERFRVGVRAGRDSTCRPLFSLRDAHHLIFTPATCYAARVRPTPPKIREPRFVFLNLRGAGNETCLGRASVLHCAGAAAMTSSRSGSGRQSRRTPGQGGNPESRQAHSSSTMGFGKRTWSGSVCRKFREQRCTGLFLTRSTGECRRSRARPERKRQRVRKAFSTIEPNGGPPDTDFSARNFRAAIRMRSGDERTQSRLGRNGNSHRELCVTMPKPSGTIEANFPSARRPMSSAPGRVA